MSKPMPQAKARNNILDRWCFASSLFCETAEQVYQGFSVTSGPENEQSLIQSGSNQDTKTLKELYHWRLDWQIWWKCDLLSKRSRDQVGGGHREEHEYVAYLIAQNRSWAWEQTTREQFHTISNFTKTKEFMVLQWPIWLMIQWNVIQMGSNFISR